ncbi:hypothetical protein [Empedobacter falsenii]|uniref:Uncharacterized protein n=1 Tax=Empedobacter falsenii TaxID=343874 RepID=A0AAW7DH02_9FLAO|nr:hypothetical protein [Empedobacter falsenii]MDM1551274.1 hypothetical protein [Empedobacter falsenii]
MKQLLITTITLLLVFNVNAQYVQSDKQAIALNKEIFKIIKKNSLFTNELNWKNIENESKALVLEVNGSDNEQIIFDFT